mgnify:CR=1 FL=1
MNDSLGTNRPTKQGAKYQLNLGQNVSIYPTNESTNPFGRTGLTSLKISQSPIRKA